MHAALQDALILTHGGTTDARVALHLEVIAQRAHHLLDLLRELASGREHERLALLLLVVELLQHAGAESRSLTGTGLRLLDHVETLGKGHDTALLDRGGLLETVRVDTAEQVLVEVHGVEGLVHLGPVGDGHLTVGLLVLVKAVSVNGGGGRVSGGVARSGGGVARSRPAATESICQNFPRNVVSGRFVGSRERGGRRGSGDAHGLHAAVVRLIVETTFARHVLW